MSADFVAAQCPSCGARSEQVPASLLGRNVRCPRCTTTFRVAAATATPRIDPPTRLEEAPATTPEAPPPTTPEDEPRPSATPSAAIPPGDEWKVGETVAGLYEITGVLGQGGMGRVYRARHRGWDLDLAIKTPLPRVLEAVGGAAAFEREAETWVGLGLHPHIVTCYYVRRLSGVPRVFAEFLDGGSLLDWIRGGRLPDLAGVLDIAVQFAWGLQYAHDQGLVHRDVKPANVLLSSRGDVKVTDFGLARAGRLDLAPEAAGRGGTVAVAGGAAGTPAYMSPEQLAGETLTRRSDLWSFGLSVVEMFAGARNWDYGSAAPEVLSDLLARPASGRPVIPKRVADLLLRCFDSEPERRPHDLGEAAGALISAYEEASGRPYPRTPPRAGHGSADSLNNRAVSLLDLERPREAQTLWERALELSPQHLETTFNFTVHEWSAGRLDDAEAERRLAEAAKGHGGVALAPQLMARYLLATGDFGRALASLDGAAALGAPESELARERAQALAGVAGTRDDRAAWTLVRDAFTRSIELGEGEALELAGQAFALGRLGDTAGATTLYKQALTARTDLPADLTAAARTLVPGQERLTTLRGLSAAATALAVTPDGREIVAGGGGREARVWDAATGALKRKVVSEDGRLRALAVTPDGRHLVWVAEDAPLRVFDLAQGRALRAVVRGSGTPLCLALSPDGGQALVGSSDRTLRVFDLASGALVRSLEGHEDGVFAVAAGRERIVSGGRDGTVRVWDAATGAPLAVHRGHQGRVSAVLLDEARGRIVSAGDDRTVRVWPLVPETAPLVVLRGATQAISALALTADGRRLATASLDRGLRLYELAPERLFAVIRLDAAVHALCASGGGLVAAHGSMVSRIGIPERSRIPHPVLVRPLTASAADERQRAFDEALLKARGHQEAGDLELAYDALVAARGVEGYGRAEPALRAWDDLADELPRVALRAAWEERVVPAHTDAVLAVAVGPAGQVASAGLDRTLCLFSLDPAVAPATFARLDVPVASLVFAPQGNRLAGGARDNAVRVWDVASGATRASAEGHAGYVVGIAISTDGARLASASLDQSVRLWRLDGTAERTLPGHPGGAAAVAFSPDGRVLVSGGWDGAVRTWNPDTGTQLALLEGHRGNVNAVAVSPHGLTLASAGADGTARVWDAQTRRESAVLKGHEGELTALAYFGDGKRLATAARDATVRVWNVATARCERVLSHGSPVLGLALSPRGERLVAACSDGSVRVWRLDWELERPEARLRLKPQTLRTTDEAVAAAGGTLWEGEAPVPGAPARWDQVSKASARTLLQRPGLAPKKLPWRRLGMIALAASVIALSVRAWLGPRPGLHLVPHVVRAVNTEPDLIRLAAFHEPCDAGDVNVYLERARAPEVAAPDLACLAATHDPGVVAPYLSTLSLDDPDPYRSKRLFRNAVSLLAGLGEPAAETLCGFLGDGRDDVRRVVATALSVSNTPAARGCLLRTMAGGASPLARATAVSALPRLLAEGEPSVADGAKLVSALVADSEPAVRAAALGALAIFNQDFARPLAESARGDADAGVRSAADEALRAIAASRQGEALDGQN